MAHAMDINTQIHGSRIPFLSAAMAAALAAAAPLPMPAAANDALLRCRAPDGTIGYTDRSCAVFGSESVPLPGDLMARIARDEARAIDFDSIDAGSMQTIGLDQPGLNQPAAPGRRSPTSGCARSPTQLAMDVHAALALGDVNRVAESYHFAGMSSDAGERTLDRLQRLVDRPVLDSQYFDASISSAGGNGFVDGATLLAGPGDGGTGMLQLVLGNGEGGATTVDFDVHRYAGCYFVRF
jgi:hypothetical protein